MSISLSLICSACGILRQFFGPDRKEQAKEAGWTWSEKAGSCLCPIHNPDIVMPKRQITIEVEPNGTKVWFVRKGRYPNVTCEECGHTSVVVSYTKRPATIVGASIDYSDHKQRRLPGYKIKYYVVSGGFDHWIWVSVSNSSCPAATTSPMAFFSEYHADEFIRQQK